MPTQRYAVIVDPLGTGAEYAAAFRAAGVEPVAVLTSDPPPTAYRTTWRPEEFTQVHVDDGDPAALAKALLVYQPLCVIPGAETGVLLADALVDLVVPGTGNAPALSTARRDKCAMAQAVRGAGLPHLRQTCATRPEAIDRWLYDTGLLGSRLVVKPPSSAGTDNVHVVAPGADWRPYFDRIYGQVNELDLRNEAVLVQEFADGTEYLVDSYSVDGRHGLVDVCRYGKSQRGDRIGIYDLVEFLPPDDPGVAVVWAYTRQILDAVGIRNGCGHTEVILTADGPRLLETAARPAGGGHQMITKLATGSNQILRTIAHRVRGEFADGYALRQHVCSVVVSAPHAGIWHNADLFDHVDTLDTFWAKHFDFGTGDTVPAPASMGTFLGWVVLAGTDREAVHADYRRIKALEKRITVSVVSGST